MEICRQYAINDATFFNPKSKYGGIDVSQLNQIKATETELSQHRKMYVKLVRENYVLKNPIKKHTRR